MDNIGLWKFSLNYINVTANPLISYVENYNDFANISIIGNVSVNILKESGDTNLEWTFTMGQGNAHLIYSGYEKESATVAINNAVLNVSRSVGTYDMYIMLSFGQTTFKLTGPNFLVQVEQ